MAGITRIASVGRSLGIPALRRGTFWHPHGTPPSRGRCSRKDLRSGLRFREFVGDAFGLTLHSQSFGFLMPGVAVSVRRFWRLGDKREICRDSDIVGKIQEKDKWEEDWFVLSPRNDMNNHLTGHLY